MNALLVEHYNVLILLKIDAESSLAAGTRTCRSFKHGSLGHGSDNAIYTCIDYIYIHVAIENKPLYSHYTHIAQAEL